jgi:hypothetical protein
VECLVVECTVVECPVVKCTVEERPFRAAFRAVVIKGFSPRERVSLPRLRNAHP